MLKKTRSFQLWYALVLGALAVAFLGAFTVGVRRDRRARLSRPLVAAVQSGDAVRVRALLDQGADPNARDNGAPPSDRPFLLVLLDRLRHPHRRLPKSLLGPTALMIAAAGSAYQDQPPEIAGIPYLKPLARRGAGGDSSSITQLLLTHGADVNAGVGAGWSALLWAAVAGNTGIGRTLLDNGADVDARDGEGQTPLMVAAQRDDLALCQLLLSRGADVNAVDKHGWTALADGLADQEPTLLLLLNSGADVNRRYYNGETALYRAAQHGKTPAVRVLTAHGAQLDVRTNTADWDDVVWEPVPGGQTALIAAARNRYPQCVRVLLEAGANANLADADGNTALSSAAFKGEDASVAMLLAHGANPFVRNVRGRGCLDLVAHSASSDQYLSPAEAAQIARMERGNPRPTPAQVRHKYARTFRLLRLWLQHNR